MKLNELSASKPSRQAAKVFESYFGKGFRVDNLTNRQARGLLSRVRGLVLEHRRSHAFHHSEKNPAYLKLMMMESVLSTKLGEDSLPGLGGTMNPADQAKMKAAQTQAIQKIKDPTIKTAVTKTTSGQNLTPDEQKKVTSALMGAPIQTEASQDELMRRMRVGKIPRSVYQKLIKDHDRLSMAKSSDPSVAGKLKQLKDILDGRVAWKKEMATSESRRSLRRALRESEIQQAQVVLAAQDMVDNVQKMIEQATSMQFKDLPALVSQVRNEMGIDQAGQFNTDANAALSQLVQSLQESRQQLETALGVVTGQEPLGGGGDMGGQGGLPDLGDDDLGGEDDFDFDTDIDADLDVDVEDDDVPVGNLGRNRI
jgi:hypothetical protein